jgi:anaerobic selenocysteine-containing dehydrogenase
MGTTLVRTTCNRDCPDACGILAQVEDGRVVALRGDPEHPVTRGFLCYRTSRFLKRQYHPARILKPQLRRGEEFVEIPLDEALDLAAERLLAIKRESGPAAILHYRSGGSLGILKLLSDYFFEKLGPTSVKVGDICSGAGEAAQEADFGCSESNDIFDLLNAKHIINWGKNLHVSNLHLIPVIKRARDSGAEVTLIDPVRTRSADLSDRYLQIRPGGDIAFGLAVARILFEEGLVTGEVSSRCEGIDGFRALAYARPMRALLDECDLSESEARAVAEALASGPTAILVGWGMQRRLRGGSGVRILDALSAISGNLGRRGGGVSFYYRRRGAFDLSFMNRAKAPRTFREPLLGRELLAASDPPVRAIWVTCGNPVAMLPDSATVARAFERTELVVAVDSFWNDTTRRATLVLPTTTLLEDDDLLGAYGHHWIGVSRPVVPPPDGVRTDLEILQALAKRMGLESVMAGDARAWKERLLGRVKDRGASLADLERGPVKNPLVEDVAFEQGRVPTSTRKVHLICELPEVETEAREDREWPLHLLSNSTERAQSSQWVSGCEGHLPALVHPDAVPGLADGALARLSSRFGALTVRIEHDATQRKDVVIVPKGGHYDDGWAANALIEARATDYGDGAAYLSTRVRLEAITGMR